MEVLGVVLGGDFWISLGVSLGAVLGAVYVENQKTERMFWEELGATSGTDFGSALVNDLGNSLEGDLGKTWGNHWG